MYIFMGSGNNNVAVVPADCRLMVFPEVTEATQFWVKGKVAYHLISSCGLSLND